jgi:hypothetical protein
MPVNDALVFADLDLELDSPPLGGPAGILGGTTVGKPCSRAILFGGAADEKRAPRGRGRVE